MKMSNTPKDVLAEFMKENHVMRHIPGIWNGMWSDMIIDTTIMRCDHGPGGMVGLTLHQNSLDKWALSMHMYSPLEHQLLQLKESSSEEVTRHKEGHDWIKSDNSDRENIRKMVEKSINPFLVDGHPKEIVNIVSGRLSSPSVNVDEAVDIGTRQQESFESSLPEKFYAPLKKLCTAMDSVKMSIKIDDIEIIALIYSRIIAVQCNYRMTLNMSINFYHYQHPCSMIQET